MNAPQVEVDLHDGWSFLFRYKKTSNGHFSGIAAITLLGLQQGALVITHQPSPDTAIALAKLRVSEFVLARNFIVSVKGWRQRGAEPGSASA
jgi:hypothetical protein